MAAEVSADLSLIQDEDVLRRMWQQTEDFGRKKEIRARMYKIREQRLKDFYTTGEVVTDAHLTTLKHTATKHADSIADQGFLSMKSKEIRDSESPTRDIHRRLQTDNNYWNTVQESYSTSDHGGRLVDSYERTLAGDDVSPDGRTQTKSSAAEKHQQSSFLEEKDDSTRQEEQLKKSAQASINSRTKTDDGEISISASKQEDRQKSSSYTTSKSGNTTSYSSSKQESSSSSTSSRQVVTSSSSSTYKILPSGERVLVSTTSGSGTKALTGGDDDNYTTHSTGNDVTDHISTEQISSRNKNTSVSDYNRENYENISSKTNVNDSRQFIINEKIDVDSQDNNVVSRDHTFSKDENEISSRRQVRNQESSRVEVENSNFVDQKIMTELQKLDSYLSTQNTTGTTTPVSPHSVTGDAANWTVVSSTDGEFVFKNESERSYTPNERPGLIKHPSSLDLPKEPTEGQYVTTYQQSYQPKKISVEHSPTHDAFARSLRASPPPSTTRSSSKGSLDRSSPERKFKSPGSPTRASPEKERRVSVASSYTVEKPKEVKRKVSETVRGTKDTNIKSKRKFSTTQTKATTKVRASTPGTSPSTSPTRLDRSQTSSSDSESDSSQLTYNKSTSSSTLKRKDTIKSSDTITKTDRTSPVRSSPERSPPRKSPSPTKQTTGILRKDSKTASSSTITRSESPVKHVGKSPSVSPERAPKSPRDSPTRKITVNSEKTSSDDFIKHEINTRRAETKQEFQETSQKSTEFQSGPKQPQLPDDDQLSRSTVQSEVVINTQSVEKIPEQISIRSSSDDILNEKTTLDEINENSRVVLTNDNINITITTHKVSDETLDSAQERQDKSPVTSPVVPDQRDKSPEYSSEGSVSREIKLSKSVKETTKSKSPDSSPERSAFKPIKNFRTNPELKTIDVQIQEHKHPAGAPSPVSPKQKTTPKSRETSPAKSPSPTRSAPSTKESPSKRSPVRETKSSSISPCTSPERTTGKSSKSPSVSPERKTNKVTKSPTPSPERKTSKKAPETKPGPQKTTEPSPDKNKPDKFRTTRRSSIPRAEVRQTDMTKKLSEKKIEIKVKPTTNRVNSFEHKKVIQKNLTPRTSSQGSLTRQSVTKTFKSTTVREVTNKPQVNKIPSATRIKTTAVINVNKPDNKTPVNSRTSKVGSNTVINITIAPKTQKTTTTTTTTKIARAPTNKTTMIKSNVLKDRNIIRKETAKEQKVSKTHVTHKDDYDGSSDRSSSVSSPETVRPAENAKNVTSNVAISLICGSNVISNQYHQEDFKIDESIVDLENELPPAEFLVDDYDDDESRNSSPVRPTSQSLPKTTEKPAVTKQGPPTPKKPITTRQSSGSLKSAPQTKTPVKSSPTTPSKTAPVKKTTTSITLKKASNDNLVRTLSDKSIKKDVVTKQEIKTKTQVTRVSSAKKLTPASGITNKQPTTQKPVPPKTAPKKRPVQQRRDSSSSSSTDDETDLDIPTNVHIISQDEQVTIDELEDIRRREEQEYASKLTATTAQEDSLLNVIIQHPKSSRESSPGYPQDQPYCTVSDDGGAHPRYADLIIEPEEVETFNIPHKRTPNIQEPYETYPTQPKQFEQVTDLDESDIEEKLNVSVADRVSQFLESTEAAKTTKVAAPFNDTTTQPPKDSPKAVLKAKQMFETIAKNQTAPPAPNNKPVDILSRPSVFEARRGFTAPKEKFDTFPRRKSSESPEPINRSSSIQELIEDNYADRTEVTSTTVIKSKTLNRQEEVTDETDLSIKVPQKQKSPSPVRETKVKERSPSPAKEPTRKKSPSPVKDVQTKKPITKDSVKTPVSDSTKFIQSEITETKKSRANQISTKRDFFENKAKTDQTVSKTKPTTPVKIKSTTQTKKVVSESHTETTNFIQNERISSPRASPERKVPSKTPEGPKPSKTTTKETDSTSTRSATTRKVSGESPERKRPSSPLKDKKEPVRSISPTKDQKERVRSSPEKQLPTRKESLTKQKSPERQFKNESPREKSPEKSKTPVREVKSPERNITERKSSLKRSSPERKISVETSERREYTRQDSSDRTIIVQKHGDVVELNRAGRFGVTLRRTSSTGSAGTPRRTSTPGGDEIEDIFKLELLEQMLEKAVGYEQRRRIRSQMRVVKKIQDDARSARKSSRSPVKEIQPQQQSRPTVEKPQEKTPESKKPVYEQKPATQRAASPVKNKVEPQPKSPTVETKPSTEFRKPSGTISPKKETSPVRQTEVRRSSKTESTIISSTTSSTVRTPAREREPCPITSSYGVGPTDEHGRPLFGLKALRRSNTSKTLTDEVVEQEQHQEQRKQQVEVTETEQICDARGRPLFGLKALQVSSVDTQEMPEVSSTQLRGLVEKHEQHVTRERTTSDSQPRQKPKAKLRDSFILQEDETLDDKQHVSNKTTTTTTPQRGGVSLRSLIQKHEGISSSGGTVHREMESKTTVITSRSTVSSDGTVSLSQDVIKGEVSAKNGEEPSGKITHTKYSYQTPDEKDKTQAVTTTTTTTTSIGGRRASGPKITEIEESDERRSSITSESSLRRFSNTKITDFEETDSSKMTRDHTEETTKKFSSGRRFSQDLDDNSNTSGGGNFVSSAIKRFSSNKTDDDNNQTNKKSTTVSSAKFISSTASSIKKSNLSNNSSLSSSPVVDNSKTKTVSSSTVSSSVQKQNLRKDTDSEDQDSDDKKKPLIRGDSVRALQHKFQQATETAANSTSPRGYPPAGLILRTSSFKTTEEVTPPISSSLKQHSSVSSSENSKQTSQSSPTGRQVEKHHDTKTVLTNDGFATSTRTSQATSTTTTSRVATEKSSFLDNTSKVSGVQDILNRMRNADLVVETGDTNEDQEARALLNKFLGASVILQGMEQGMKYHNHQQQQNGHHSLPASPTSAALVSRVEKQRMASVTSTQQQEIEDLDNIWDEQQLRDLLQDCSDYEGRRKIRARLRNVMAEHKACADIVAVTAADATGNSMLSQEFSESKKVSTKVEDSSFSHSEVHTRTSSTFSSQQRMTKANSVTSPFQKFKQLERQNSAPSRGPSDTPIFKFTDPKLARSASSIKDRLLFWVQAQTKEYKNVQIDNFSTSWSNGLAFCALIHHFCPEAFDYDKLTPEQRRYNFELAFRVADEEADIAPLLDVEDMVAMRRPDWKCVFTYVQSIYRRFHATPEAVRP